MEKNPGGQKFWQRGEGRFREILSCPPPKCVLPLKCPPKFRDLAPPLPRTAARTTSLATKSCPEFNFRHKFSLLVVGPTQSGKMYFVQRILENNRIVYEEQKSIRIFWYYNQWQECYEKLKKSLGKSIRFERGVPELSEDLCEINPRYNNIIILDDLMAEATDSPVVSRLFTQGQWRRQVSEFGGAFEGQHAFWGGAT